MSDVTIDQTLVRWTVDGAPAREARAIALLAERPLLVLLHGYGASETDLLGLAPALPPGYVCASLRAPLPVQEFGGFAWAPLVITEAGQAAPEPSVERFEGTPYERAARGVIAWIDAIEQQVTAETGRGIAAAVLLGFSQGGCMVTSLLRVAPQRFAAGVICSGFVAPGFGEYDVLLSEVRPPVFWGRDPADPVIDAARVQSLAEWLPHHVEATVREYAGIGHSIGPGEAADIAAFLVAHVRVGADNAGA
ncbi:dienelactone hydrolase family protein [Leucobacter tardus]|uniref:alpha/beta hydrolase n=1 Tax=Leucobacter tardus TaxID=501483 RepID=UPI001FBB7E95|nr:hypothetical protein [Leucobacter tardus]